MLKWKFPAAVFFLLVILPFFSACGKEEILTIEIPEEQEAYQTREVLLDGIQKAWLVQISEGFYYVMAKKPGNKIVMLKLNKNGEILEETPLDIRGETIISIEDFRIEEDGGISCLAVMTKQDAVSASSWNARYLCFDKNGRKASGTLLRFPEEETGSVSDGMFTEDGMLFLASNGLYLFREDGTFSQKYKADGSSFCLLEKDACVSSALSKTASIKRIGLEKGELIHESRIGLSAIRYQSLLCAAEEKSGYDLIIADNEGIYGYCFQPEKITELLSWQEKDIVIGNMAMYDFLVTGEEYVVLLDANPGCSLLFVSRDMGQKKKEKEALTLCGIGLLSDNMKIAVAVWNKEHDDQRIVMETRDSDQLALDIASGDGPDIIVADASVEAGISVLKNLSEKGYFADWYRLMEQDASGLQKKDLLHNIREIYETEQGELFYLPVSYLVGFSAASVEDVKDRKRWSFDDMDALLSEKREEADSVGIFAENKLDLAKTLLRYGFDDYYSPEEGLKTENLKKLLSFIQRWQTGETDGTAFFSSNTVPLNFIQGMLMELEKEYGKNGYRFIGYPCEDGMGIPVFEFTVCSIAGNTDHALEAWKFVQSFYTYEAQSYLLQDSEHPYSIVSNGFPVRKDALETVWKENLGSIRSCAAAMAKNYVLSADRNPAVSIDEDVYDIISEELQAYDSGDKDLEETVDIMENRAGLYTKERNKRH